MLLSREDPKYEEVVACAPDLIIERPRDGAPRPTEESMARGVNPERLRNVRTSYILRASPAQIYVCNGLDKSVHFQLPKGDTEKSYIPQCLKVQKNGNRDPLQVVVIHGDMDYEDEFLMVRNNLDPALLSSLDQETLMDRMEAVQRDNHRGHRRIDYGATGHNNSTREEPLTLGLAIPRCHAGTNDLAVAQFVVAAWRVVRQVLPPEWSHLFNDAERNSLFAHRYAGTDDCDAESCGLTNSCLRERGLMTVGEHLSPHLDRQNDTSNRSYRKTVPTSQLLHNPRTDSLIRSGQTFYGKKSCADYMAKHRLYLPVLSDVTENLRFMSPWETVLDTSLMPDPAGPEGNLLPNPHNMKTVFYSPFCYVIAKLHAKYEAVRSNSWFLVIFLYCTCISNSVHVFWYEVKALLDDPCCLTMAGMPFYLLEPESFAWLLYNHLFDVNQQLKPRRSGYTPHPRHRPAHNKRATREQLFNSLSAVARVLVEIDNVPVNELRRNVRFYHSRAAAYLAMPCAPLRVDETDSHFKTGAFCNGPLIAQHTLAIASGCGAIDECFLFHAELAKDTNTWKFLKANYGFSDSRRQEHSCTLLDALASYHSFPRIMAEEAVCKLAKRRAGTYNHHMDYIPLHCPMLCDDPTRAAPGTDKVAWLHPDGSLTGGSRIEMTFTGKRHHGVFWNTKFEDRLPGRKTNSSSVSTFCLSSHFPLLPRKSSEALLSGTVTTNMVPVPHPQTVIFTSPREDEFGRFNADVILRDFLQTSNGTSERNIYSWEKLVVPKGTDPVIVGGMRARRSEAVRGGGKAYISHGIKIPPELSGTGEEVLHWLDDTFGVRTDYNGDDKSVTHDGRRWYETKEDSKLHALLSLLLTRQELFVPGMIGHRILNMVGAVECQGDLYFPDGTHTSNEGHISSIKVWSARGTQAHPGEPFLVSVRYRMGGTGHYLCDGHGRRNSAVQLVLPPLVATRNHRNRAERVPFLGILAHRDKDLLIRWEDGLTTWEKLGTFGKEAPWAVCLFAAKHGLQEEPGWKRLCCHGRAKKRKLPDMLAEGVSDSLTIKQAMEVETKLKQEWELKLCEELLSLA